MRVFFITTKLNFETSGGSVADIHLKARILKEQGYDVTVVTAFSRFDKINKDLPYNVMQEYMESRGLIGIQRGVYNIIKKYQHQADVFHIDGQVFLYGAGFYRMMGGRVPVVAFFNHRLNCMGDPSSVYQKISWHIELLKWAKKKLRFFLEHRIGVIIANKIDAFIFNTPLLEKLYVDFGLKKEKSSLLPDFVDIESILLQERLTEAVPKTFTIFCSGRMLPEKGFDLVIRAISKIVNKEAYRVIMCGSGPDEERLKNMVKDMGLEKFFSFPGWVTKNELSELMRQSHIFVYPKWWKEYGSALLMETMAHGLPCIVPAGGSLEWLAQDAAICFQDNDFENLAKAIEKLCDNYKTRITLSKKALLRAERLDYKVLSVPFEGLMRTVLLKQGK